MIYQTNLESFKIKFEPAGHDLKVKTYCNDKNKKYMVFERHISLYFNWQTGFNSSIPEIQRW